MYLCARFFSGLCLILRPFSVSSEESDASDSDSKRLSRLFFTIALL